MRVAPFPLMVILLVPNLSLHASMSGTFQGEQRSSRDLVDQAQKSLRQGDLPLKEMGQGKDPGLSEASVSEENIAQSLKESSAGQWVLEQEKRPDKKLVVIDPTHDPLMKSSTEIVQDPMGTLKAKATVIQQEGGVIEEDFSCEEAADPFEVVCAQNLVVDVKAPAEETHLVTASVSGRFSSIKYCNIEGEKGWGALPWIKLWDGVGLYLWEKKSFGSSGKFVSYPGHYGSYGAYGSVTVSPDLTSVLKEVDPQSVRVRLVSSDVFLIHHNVDPSLVRLNVYKSYKLRETYKDSVVSDTLVFEVTFKSKPQIVEKWDSSCAALEALSSDEGYAPCDLIEEKCTQGPQTRTINGEAVYRPCWQKTRYYLCGRQVPSTCGEYRIRGCTQVGSACAQKIGPHCSVWKQTYRCAQGVPKRQRTSIKGGDTPWCLDGNCYTPSWDANTDMLNAVSKMATLQEMQKDLKDLAVFTGQGLKCRRGCLDFQNCCGTSRGWGISLRFAACDDDEKLLSQKQNKGLCVFLGTYCSKRFLGASTQKKSTSCCFESRIARIIQVAARQQLGLSWGSAEHPQCRGLTPQELSRVDLEKVDFRELYEEIMARYKAPKVIVPQKETLTKNVKDVSRGEPGMGKEGL